jgi:hypothetical protein
LAWSSIVQDVFRDSRVQPSHEIPTTTTSFAAAKAAKNQQKRETAKENQGRKLEQQIEEQRKNIEE